MSRQSKNARNLAKARQITALHLKGEKGPAKTSPAHGKVKAWWKLGQGDYGSFVSGGKKKAAQEA